VLKGFEFLSIIGCKSLAVSTKPMICVMIWFRPDFSMSLALDEGLASYEAWIQRQDTMIRRRRYRIRRSGKKKYGDTPSICIKSIK
jgi:hypothetical protein